MYRISLVLIPLLIMTSCSIESQQCTKDDTLKLVSAGFTKEEISDICGPSFSSQINNQRDRAPVDQPSGKQSGELTRSIAEQKFNVKDWYVEIRVGAHSHWDDGKVLLENGYVYKQYKQILGPDLHPTAKLSPYHMDTKSGEALGRMSMATYLLLVYGRVKEIKATGITKIGENVRKVEYLLTVEPNDVGRLFGNNKLIPLVATYQLYDDGWRYKGILWSESNSLSSWNKEYLQAFKSDLDVANALLWNMHERNQYSPGFDNLLIKLEESSDPKYLDTVAWVYKDNGEIERAVKIYMERVLPAIKKSGDSEQIRKFQEHFNKIKFDPTQSPGKLPHDMTQSSGVVIDYRNDSTEQKGGKYTGVIVSLETIIDEGGCGAGACPVEFLLTMQEHATGNSIIGTFFGSKLYKDNQLIYDHSKATNNPTYRWDSIRKTAILGALKIGVKIEADVGCNLDFGCSFSRINILN